MADLLLIAFTIALLLFAHLMRTLLALRVPSDLLFKPTKLKQPPDIMGALFDQVDRELSDLGFSSNYWATVESTPPLPGFHAPLIRLYHHKSQPIIARVNPPHTLSSIDQCQVVFLSISTGKTFLATANRTPELFPRPPEARSIMLNTDVDTLAEQFREHIQEMAQRGLSWLDRSKEMGEHAWVFRLANRYEKKGIKWIFEQGYVKRLSEGGGIPTFGTVLRFIWRLVTVQSVVPPQESEAIPAGRAAYLFLNWRAGNRAPLPLTTQLALFLVSALAFTLLAGLFWGWHFSLLLLGVIAFHEAGHWLTMRLLGYRNLQILMLPLVGGVTLGQEETPNTAQRILVSLMGPLPGIVLGLLILWIDGMGEGWLSDLGVLLLAVNYLNLLPVMPLDGGQLLKTLIPSHRFELQIALEWLGALALFALAWWADSLLLAALALLPLFGGLGVLKRKAALTLVETESRDIQGQPLNEQIASIIQAMDLTDKRYRPLAKKVQDIEEILTLKRLTPVTPKTLGIFLAIYLVVFLLPPMVLYAAKPEFRTLSEVLFTDIDAIHQEAYAQAMALPMAQLATELAEAHGKLSRRHDLTVAGSYLKQPATDDAIARAERRLGILFDTDYRQFLKTSNGLGNYWMDSQETNYLLFPVERIESFATKLPELETRARVEMTRDNPLAMRVYQASAEGENEPQTLYLEQIGPMLFIGQLHDTAYLLLDPRRQSHNTPAPLIIIDASSDDLEGIRYKGLRDYLADDLALVKASYLDPDD